MLEVKMVFFWGRLEGDWGLSVTGNILFVHLGGVLFLFVFFIMDGVHLMKIPRVYFSQSMLYLNYKVKKIK